MAPAEEMAMAAAEMAEEMAADLEDLVPGDPADMDQEVDLADLAFLVPEKDLADLAPEEDLADWAPEDMDLQVVLQPHRFGEPRLNLEANQDLAPEVALEVALTVLEDPENPMASQGNLMHQIHRLAVAVLELYKTQLCLRSYQVRATEDQAVDPEGLGTSKGPRRPYHREATMAYFWALLTAGGRSNMLQRPFKADQTLRPCPRLRPRNRKRT
jgi:hypothetical protein